MCSTLNFLLNLSFDTLFNADDDTISIVSPGSTLGLLLDMKS